MPKLKANLTLQLVDDDGEPIGKLFEYIHDKELTPGPIRLGAYMALRHMAYKLFSDQRMMQTAKKLVGPRSG